MWTGRLSFTCRLAGWVLQIWRGPKLKVRGGGPSLSFFWKIKLLKKKIGPGGRRPPWVLTCVHPWPQGRNKTQRMKTQWLIHATRVKQAAERATKLDKPTGNGKHMNTRRAMDSYGSRLHTQGLGTTYLYPTNTEEVGHGSKVRKCVAW